MIKEVKSNSANETDMRTIAAINSCQIGTSHTADFIAPRRHYHCLQSADEYMSLQILSIDQARMQCESVVLFIAKDASLWRGKLKQQCRKLCNKNVTYPLPVCNEINQSICRNMTDDEILSFSCMASHIDDVIQPELNKLSNSVLLEIGRHNIPNVQAMTKVLSCYLYCAIAREILIRCRQVQRGSRYLLCANPLDANSRQRAYDISVLDIDRMIKCLQAIIRELAHNHTFEVPYTDGMMNGVTIICNKMTDTLNIYRACAEGGINAGHQTFAELEDKISKINADREARKHKAVEHPVPAPPKQTKEDIANLFASKGWNVTTA